MSLESINSQEQKEHKETLSKKISGWVRRGTLAGVFALNAFNAFAGTQPTEKEKDSDHPVDITQALTHSDFTAPDFSNETFLSIDDFKESRLDTLQFVNYFEVDKATISPEHAESIAHEFTLFLDRITLDNVQELLDKDFIIFASCDERPTLNWGPEGNRLLAEERARVIVPILETTLDHYDFGSRIHADDVKALQNKLFTIITPEDGVITVEEITGKTANQLSPEALHAAYAQARQVNFMIGMESEFVTTPEVILEGEFEGMNDDAIAKIFNQYNKILFVADVSPSMKKNYDRMMAGFEASYKESGVDIISKKTFSVLPYSHELHTEYATLVSSQDDLAAILDRLTTLRIGDTKEAPIEVAQKIIDKNGTDTSESKLMSIMFDEGLPNVSRADMEKLVQTAGEKGIDVAFFMIRQSDGHVTILTPEKILQIIDENEKQQAAKERYNIDVNETKVGDNGRTVSPDILVQGSKTDIGS